MIELDGRSLTLDDLDRVAAGGEAVRLAARVPEALARSRGVIDRALAAGLPVYGVNTGFGDLKNRHIGEADLARLQLNLLRSHAAGVGRALSLPEVRALGLLRANALAVGVSGVRLELVERVLLLLNRRVHPVVPEQGSVGASGDLAPLAHFALVLVGEGRAEFRDKVQSGAESLAAAEITPISLAPKEGLALINGTQLSTAVLALTLCRAGRVVRAALGANALSLEGLLGSIRAFDPRAMAVRPHPGQGRVARALIALTEGSDIVASHADCDRIQDPYSLRCAPQVLGASLDALAYATVVVTREMNSATDNPLVFADGDDVISSGNFHAQPIGMVADHVAAALSEVGAIAERRLDLLTDAKRSNGLPAFLTPNPGLNSGLMLVQYTAAALASENKTLCFPATVDSIPTSAGQEDHVSMAPTAARKARAVLENLARIVACELVAGAQAVEFRAPLLPGRGTQAVLAAVRARVPRVTDDRPLGDAIEALARDVLAGGFDDAVRPHLGEGDLP
ncbi:MAG: histidine ammonia-lyase [Candidatus Eisenbacteria bacterium]